MGLQRPVWTVCFGLIWVIIAIGAIVMHVALSDLVPAFQALPGNLALGFNEVFGFSQLTTEAANMKASAVKAIEKCSLTDAASYCQRQQAGLTKCTIPGADTTKKDMNAEKDEIVAAFDRGLEKIIKVGTDKYFGMEAFEQAAGKLTNIKDELDKVDANGPCCATTELFCEMRKNSDELSKMGNEINNMIDTFVKNDAVKVFEAQVGNLMGLHALPYVLVLSTTFFAILWYKNGACCCCSHGSCLQVVLLIVPQVLLWLVSFVIMTVFTGIGWAFTFVVLPMQIESFNGSPTLADLLDHIHAEFRGFWDLVLAPLVSGLDTFRTASTIFSLACVFVIVYSCCFCCRRPYGSGEKPASENKADDSKEDSTVV
eukprot:TRINITY_DN1697_c0_g1_i2.p1 TRINITY_DN1697_c0_g1~~TRINITY_DN1697_c0_g1_i2.p1  ORF type:complete len:371 (+),score=108.85 TRINITY_DN1697_c0_g1_i2:132-1244(+)